MAFDVNNNVIYSAQRINDNQIKDYLTDIINITIWERGNPDLKFPCTNFSPDQYIDWMNQHIPGLKSTYINYKH